MSEKLKPCPFPVCGSSNTSMMSAGAGGHRRVHWVCCNECSACGPEAFAEAKAIKEWNTRASGGVSVNVDLLEALEERYTQTKCGCGHPRCNRCKDDSETEAVLAKAKGEL